MATSPSRTLSVTPVTSVVQRTRLARFPEAVAGQRGAIRGRSFVIVTLGCSAALGSMHTGHHRSFAYDIADPYKTELSITSENTLLTLADARASFC